MVAATTVMVAVMREEVGIGTTIRMGVTRIVEIIAAREGYVPNVVYSCGSMVHGRELILPFAVSDLASTIVSVSLDELLSALKGGVS